MVVGLATWAIVLSLRLNPVLDTSVLKESANARSGAVATIAAPATLYESQCSSCHGRRGEGRYPVFPPLVMAPTVIGPPDRLLGAVLQGVSGPIEVNGVAYDGYMPAFDGRLTDQEVASLLTYVRSSWGNSASELSEKDVAAFRQNSRSARESTAPGGAQP